MKLILSFLVFMSCLINPKALTIDKLYGDLSSTSSNTENLLLYAQNLDEGFFEKDYVIFRAAQYDFYIVWGDLEFSNNKVTGTDIQYVRYVRSDSMIYSYQTGSDSTFTLSNVNYLVTSNVNGLGISSPVYNTMLYEYHIKLLSLFSTALILGVFVLKLRKE